MFIRKASSQYFCMNSNAAMISRDGIAKCKWSTDAGQQLKEQAEDVK